MNKALIIPPTKDLFRFEPDPAQIRAVKNAAEHKMTVITGGPGTGKTATTSAIIKMFEANNRVVGCAAPTGKAAIRMSEQTGRDASTIHRLLQWSPEGFRHNSHRPQYAPDGRWVTGGPVPYTALVIDEMSMVTTELCYHLLDAISDRARVVLVGDVDQLPSIGPGRVLHDIIQSNKVPTTRLTKIFRQASESRIPYVARDINSGSVPTLDQSDDFFFAHVDSPEDVLRQTVRAFREVLPNRGFSMDDIQVIAPQRNHACGVENMNVVLQRELNARAANERDLVSIGRKCSYNCAQGDRVIHTANNYQLGVFNGEIGKVVAANWRGLQANTLERLAPVEWGVDSDGNERSHKKSVVVVNYGDRKIAYSADEARDLELAYAITIHKSQGSQFKAVVMPVHSCHQFMLTRPLVYTGITRAESFLLMVGQEQALARSINNRRGVFRRTTLQEHLAEPPPASTAPESCSLAAL